MIICVAGLIYPAALHARPVSYPGGWTGMSMNDEDMNSLHIHYSPTAKYSLGYKTAFWRAKKFQTHSLKVNNLLRRWNNPDSQANLYLKSGAGLAADISRENPDPTEPHVFSGMSFDWENRRLFSQYENAYHYSGEIDESFEQFIRLGIAPYIGEYGDFHTWLMLKAEHDPGEKDSVTLTPHLRFFKGEYLLEIGYSENKEVFANFEVRF
jgi:hypothetical protein